MGWNDHVDFVEKECLDCGSIETWECWNEVALARYSGELGRKLGHDATKSDRCPSCGSKRGKIVPEDDEPWGWDD